jgi:ectoine hydroxylase-related dioxygenase (phytanoyl-CoA dioxygenase family)
MAQDDRGYAIYERIFDRHEMAAAVEALAHADMARSRAGARHVLAVPAVRDLATDARLVTIATQLVGPAPVVFRATLFEKSPSSNWLVVWHQDTALPLRSRIDDPAWGPWSMKAGVLYAHAPSWALETVVALRVHLDDSTAANGPLRVLPGTHLRGVLSDEQIEQLARDTTAVDCVAASGGVVAMRPLTVHASSKSTRDNPRRVLHIEYAAAVNLGSRIELAVG